MMSGDLAYPTTEPDGQPLRGRSRRSR